MFAGRGKKSLVGGNSMWQLTYFRMFTPQIGQDEPILTVAYVQKGLKLNHQLNLYFCFPIFSPSFQRPPVFCDRRRLLPFRTPPLWTSDASNDASHEGGIWSLEDDWKGRGVFTCFCDVICTCWGIYKFRNYRYCNIFIYTI